MTNKQSRESTASDSSGGTRQAKIVTGRHSPLEKIAFHEAGPLTRWLLAGAEIDPGCRNLIAVHQFDSVPEQARSYCQLHTHPYDEINVLISNSSLRVEVRLADQTHVVDAPASVFIPSGIPHSANVISGSGFLVAVLAGGTYEASGV